MVYAGYSKCPVLRHGGSSPPPSIAQMRQFNSLPAKCRITKMENAELLNGRLAMLGFVIGVATELITHQGIVAQVLSIFS